MAVDVRAFLDWVIDAYEPRCRVDGVPGRYGRAPGTGTVHLYGVADLANILHTVGSLDVVDDVATWDAAFGELRDPADGCYVEAPPTHHRIHATAYAVSAMALVGLAPPAPVDVAPGWRDPAWIARFLDRLDWHDDVYIGSHQGAGVGALAVLLSTPACRRAGHEPVEPAWFDHYFAALDARIDPVNGMHGVDKSPHGDSDQIGGTFHYAFLHHHLGRPLPHPEARIDAVLGLRQPDGWWHPENHLWLTLDAVYLLCRDAETCGHRRGDVEDVVAATVAQTVAAYGGDGRRWFEEWYLGAHDLTAFVSLLAEAQRFAGGDGVLVDAGRTLRLVLDDRPFI